MYLPQAKWLVDAEGVEREVKKVVVDFVLTWEPRSNAPVDLMNVDETILHLANYYHIRRVTFDRWNSAGSIQRLMERGIMAEDLSFSNSQQFQMYRNLKLLVYNNLIQLPRDEALVKELTWVDDEVIWARRGPPGRCRFGGGVEGRGRGCFLPVKCFGWEGCSRAFTPEVQEERSAPDPLPNASEVAGRGVLGRFPGS